LFFLTYLIIVIVLDIITGIFKAFVEHKINSSSSFKGILKKTSYFIIIAITIVIERILALGNDLKNMLIIFLILNEIISILENCKALGLKYPKFLISALEDIENKVNSNKKTKKD